jgi:hypothetical protein
LARAPRASSGGTLALTLGADPAGTLVEVKAAGLADAVLKGVLKGCSREATASLTFPSSPDKNGWSAVVRLEFSRPD